MKGGSRRREGRIALLGVLLGSALLLLEGPLGRSPSPPRPGGASPGTSAHLPPASASSGSKVGGLDSIVAPMAAVSPPHDRWVVYRTLARTSDPEVIERSIELLRGGFGESWIDQVEEDLRLSIEEGDEESIAVTAALLCDEDGRRQRAGRPVDLEQTLRWLDLLPVSDSAALAVRGIFLRRSVGESPHFDHLLRLWREGLSGEVGHRCASDLIEWIVTILGETDPLLSLTVDEDPRLRRLGWRLLVRLDPGQFLPLVLEEVRELERSERETLLCALAGELPSETRVAQLLEWHDRFPEISLAPAWLEVGADRGGDLILAYHAAESSAVREQLLAGWTRHSLDADGAERFLIEVVDTDPDPRVRSRALVALGQVDGDEARDRLGVAVGEALGQSAPGDPLDAARLSAGLRNALARAPRDWVRRSALPFLRSRLKELSPRSRESELERWRRALGRAHPELLRELDRRPGF